MNNELKEMISLFESPKTIPKEKIIQWKKSANYEVIELLLNILTESKYVDKITPKLDFYDMFPFLIDKYIELMRVGTKIDTMLPYCTAHDLKNIIEHFWDYKYIPSKEASKVKQKIKSKLEFECLNADKQYADVIINGLLEHLFDNRKIRKYFKDWENIQRLEIFYKCSISKTEPIDWENLFPSLK